MTQVRCIICNQVEKREKLLVPKIDGLRKHASCHKTTSTRLGVAISEHYMSSFSQHVKKNDNMLLFMGKLLWLNKLQMGTL
jgi:hypothetical protein